MKYGIITHYNVLNHGAILQLEALIRTMESLGVEARALQYERNYDFTDGKLRAKYKIRLYSIFYYLKFIVDRGIGNYLFLYKKAKILARYKKMKGLVGEHYDCCGQLEGVVIGSDEVFSLEIGKTPVLFGYGLSTKKVFAYAGSFGPTTMVEIERKNCCDFVSDGLKSMCGLSMRDLNSICITEKFTGIKPDLVCDPVILYGFKDELKRMLRPMDEKYLVVYAYDLHMNESEYIEIIRDFAKQHSLKVVAPAFYHKWVDRCINTDPIGLLNWFLYAECVITDTFHGCIMSLITNRSFVARVNNNSNKVVSLLEEYGIKNRIVDQPSEIIKVLSYNKTDWNIINELLSEKREFSKKWLMRMIVS